jgi:hypothetical protein
MMDRSHYSPYRPPGHTQLYEIGKYLVFETEELSDFYDFDISESRFSILTKEGLKKLIQLFASWVEESYKKLTTATFEELKIHARQMHMEWENCFDYHPYVLDQENPDGEMAHSWKHEYAIFNLVYIYRTFDWENDYLIYSAW